MRQSFQKKKSTHVYENHILRSTHICVSCPLICLCRVGAHLHGMIDSTEHLHHKLGVQYHAVTGFPPCLLLLPWKPAHTQPTTNTTLLVRTGTHFEQHILTHTNSYTGPSDTHPSKWTHLYRRHSFFFIWLDFFYRKTETLTRHLETRVSTTAANHITGCFLKTKCNDLQIISSHIKYKTSTQIS